jgi:hypothetical protein
MAIGNLAVSSRILWKHPAFTLTAVLTIALGVGASTAIFSVTNAVLLRPLPYREPGRLVIAGMEMRKRNVHDLPFSNADYIDLRDGTKALFSDMAGVSTGRMVAPQEDGTPEQIRWAVVTANFFQLTGGKIVLGRDFTPLFACSEDSAGGLVDRRLIAASLRSCPQIPAQRPCRSAERQRMPSTRVAPSANSPLAAR